MRRSARLSRGILDEQWTDAAFAARGIETAEQWWDALALEPAFAPLLAERTQRFAGRQRRSRRRESTPIWRHCAMPGFREVGTIWQLLSNRVVMAAR